MKYFSICILTFTLLQLTGPIVQGQSEVTAKLTYSGTDFFGMPLGWDGKKIAMLGRDGKLNYVPAKSKGDLQVVANEFVPFDSQQLRSKLQVEFSSRYDISISKKFVVVHPWGPANAYLKPFENFQRRFARFFETNGVALQTSDIPLIAVVLRSRSDFDRYLINEVEVQDSQIGGYYSRVTNRITTYDPAGRLRPNNDKWLYDAKPIIHEATHQSAFNTGIHNRFAPPPKWLSEGLATLFESKGFNNAADYPKLEHRVNATRLKHLRKYLQPESIKNSLLNMIAYDRIFQTNTELAYALSWGLSLYLHEYHKENYFKFLKSDSQRENFANYSPSARLKDFAKTFGNDIEKIEQEMILMFQKR